MNLALSDADADRVNPGILAYTLLTPMCIRCNGQSPAGYVTIGLWLQVAQHIVKNLSLLRPRILYIDGYRHD